ncbi:MAG: PorP/SprF family type IX secretion system membrane protein [Bacteroidia bacterium]|nr:PorP/SprF family type IX secretion system membrane protein [Bacteroidia bacterium]
MMNKTLNNNYIPAFCCIVSIMFIHRINIAQDIHFSQCYSSPLTLNPSMSGDINGNIRVALNHRNQWNTISVPFVTSAVSFDAKMLESELKGDAFGVGMILISDKAGEANFSQLQAIGNLAFLKKFDCETAHIVSLGIQPGIFQKQINFSSLTFSSQFYGEDFDTNLPSGENEMQNKITGFDLNAGMMYKAIFHSGSTIDGGLAFFHLTRSNESMLGKENRMSIRSVAHYRAGFIIKEKLKLGGIILFMTQSKAKEICLMGISEYALHTWKNKNIDLILSSGIRVSDAIIFSAGARYEKIECIFSYDLNISTLHVASNYHGAFEIALIFNDKIFTDYKKIPFIIPCQRI